MDTTPKPAVPGEDKPSGGYVSSHDSRRHFARNSLFNVLFFAFSAVTSFFMVPYQKHYLGWDNYGMVFLANTFISYTLIVTMALLGTVFRFVTLSLAKNDLEEARGYLNTQFITTVAFVAAFFPIACAISYLTPVFLRIPSGQELNTQVLFLLVYMSFLLLMLCNPFQVAQVAKQRFDVRNLIEISNQSLRYVLWIVLFAFLVPNMCYIGLGYVLGALFALVATVLSAKKLMPEMLPSLRGFDKVKFKEMLRMGGWITVDQVGVVLYLSIDGFIINRMIGPTATGQYGVVLGLALQLRGLSSMMSSMFVPVAVAAYARKEWNDLIRHSVRAVKFTSIGMAIPLGIVCGLAAPLMARWLGPDARVLYPLVWWIMAHQVVNCGVMPLFNINVAANKIAVPGIVTVIGGVLKLVLSIVLVKYTNLGFYGVAVAGAVMFSLKNCIFIPYYAGRVLNVSSWPFYKAMVPSMLVFGAAALVALGMTRVADLASYPKLGVAALLVSAVVAPAAYFLVLNREDRAFFARVAPWSRKRNADG